MLLANGVGSNTKEMNKKDLFHFRVQSDTHHSEPQTDF